MASTADWPDFSTLTDPLDQISALSRYYGVDPQMVLAGGGNTSVKVDDRLFIKASGTTLADITPEGFVELDRNVLADLLASEIEDDEVAREERFKNTTLAARIHPERGQRPSVESVLHHLMPGAFTVHTHATYVNMLTCATNGETIARELFGDDILWLPYTTPGFVLAQALEKALADHQTKTGSEPIAVLMGNHGLLISGDTPEAVRERTERILTTIQGRVGELPRESFGPCTAVEPDEAKTLIRTIGPALRALLSDGNALKVVTFDDSPLIAGITNGADGEATAMGGPLCPDQIVYCKCFPLWFKPQAGETPDTLADRLSKAIKGYVDNYGYPPHVVLVEGLGLFGAGDTYKAARTVQEVYLDAVTVMAGAAKIDSVLYMTKGDYTFIEHWEVESYRRKVAATGKVAGRADGKVALVTGAAQGFGLEIAQGLVEQGAHVALADLNVEGAKEAAANLQTDRAIGVAMNVADEASTQNAIDAVVRQYGGFDLFVSNAGVLKAESVKTQPLKDFQFVTDVNYVGYFVCVQKAAPILAMQHRCKPDYRSDIVQINSKSGLVGSNRNGAYAGGKFGGIGLTQSFALELIEDGVKVNSICPGNFFDGPLWSDPENGLFVQYLRSGKVPGAKTIEDVRHFYEAKVPMGRGCTTADVMHTVFYLMDQQYETGQAVPVTGGQVMLS